MLFGKKKNPLEEEPLKHVKDLLLSDEEVLYISDKWIKPNHYNWYRLVLTNKRLFRVSSFADNTYDVNPYGGWKRFRRVWIDEDIVKILDVDGTHVTTLKGLPREDREIVYKTIKENIDAVSEQSDQQHPTQNLLKCLKDLLDEGLITQAEYDAKKADLLKRM